MVLYGVTIVIGFVMWGIWIASLMDWIGGLAGFLAGVFLAPGVFIYPIIHWFVEDSWPTTYLILYAASLASYFCGAYFMGRDDLST